MMVAQHPEPTTSGSSIIGQVVVDGFSELNMMNTL